MKVATMKHDNTDWTVFIIESLKYGFFLIVGFLALLFGTRQKIAKNERDSLADATAAQDRAIKSQGETIRAQEEHFKYQDRSLEELKNTISSLQRSVIELQTENATLKKLLHEATSENDQLRRQNYSLELRIKQLENRRGDA